MMPTLFDLTQEPRVMKSARISPCGTYRYTLTRLWNNTLPGVLWIMLNPSTADTETDDPTIRRCLGYARAWGCGSITVVNLFAFRATDPKALLTAEEPVGPDNDHHIRQTLLAHNGRSDYILCAWGANGAHKKLRPRRDAVRNYLPVADALCLGTTAAGDPLHPLMQRADIGPVQYEWTAK